ncbi:serine/threonine-protein kinase [Actinocrinis sp.]|uniref:serine/threonine-protein kinase n=1 Tax=Actinocrinis sp. TaxID=1920516 RepID=UPI002D3295DB|nr:serine/threonine-protein kinase [Actinocrinis sp.]HZP54179.1 serine/threonine-protein kinase [Actinocrinis sp.]
MSDPQWIGARYELLERLGGGADGSVWRGWDLATGSDCVARFVRRDSAVASGLTAAARWGQVIRTLGTVANLAHPGLVAVDDIVADEGRWALITRLIPGESLAARLTSTGALPTAEAVRLVAQLCEALAVAHEAGLAHGRVKPSNLLLEPGSDGTLTVRLTDFGLIELESWAAHEQHFAPHPATAAARVRYRPPEWIPGMPTTAAGDVYAVGVVLYEALTGHQLVGQSAVDQTAQPRPESLPPRPREIPEVLWALLTQCLEKRPRLRPTAAQVADRLRTIGSGPRPPIPHAGPPVRGRAHERRVPNSNPALPAPLPGPGRHRELSVLRRVEFAASATAVALVGSLTFTLGASDGALPPRTVPTRVSVLESTTSAAVRNLSSASAQSPSATAGAGAGAPISASAATSGGPPSGSGSGPGPSTGPGSPPSSGPATVPSSAPATSPAPAPSGTPAGTSDGLINDPIGYLEHLRAMIQQMAAQGRGVVDANAAGDLENLVLDLENGVDSYLQNGGQGLLLMIKAKVAGFDGRLAEDLDRGLISAGPAMTLAAYLQKLAP